MRAHGYHATAIGQFRTVPLFGAVLALLAAMLMGGVGASSIAQATPEVADEPAGVTESEDVENLVQSDGVEVVDRAGGMTFRVADPKKLGFLEVPCQRSATCPNGSMLIARMDDKVKVTGQVAGVSAGSKVLIKLAAVGKNGSVGPWVTAAETQLDDRGRFAKRVFISSGSHLLQVKYSRNGAEQVTRAVGGTVAIAGMPLMYVDFVNQMKQKGKYNLDLFVTTTVQTSSDCTTTTDGSNPCPVFESQAIPLNAAGSGATSSAPEALSFAYLLPVGGPNANPMMTFGFHLQKQGCVGKCSTFLTNFNAGVHGTSCGKLDTPPSTYMTSGSQWTVYLQEQTTGYNAFLDGPNMPASKKSKKYPNGCVFAVQTEFDNDISNLGIVGWFKVLLQAYKDVTAVAELVESDGADGKKDTVKQLRSTWKMVASVPNPPDWVDMSGCKTFAQDVVNTYNSVKAFGGMIAYRDTSAGRTSLIYGNAECTVPDSIYGNTLGLVQGKSV